MGCEGAGIMTKILADRKLRAFFYRILFFIFLFILISLICLRFVPEKAALFIFLAGLGMALGFLAAGFRYFRERSRIIDAASAQIMEYIAGDENARIECDEEGDLHRLFHQINSLSAILSARAEKEGRAREFLKNTISDISHQLKTPLAALNIYNGILQGEAESLPTIQEFINLSEQELDRIETLVQNLLKITKFDAGTILLEKAPESVADMMERVKKHFSYRACQEEKEIFLSGDEDAMLLCDRVWLIEAVDNIVKNALDHTKAGGVIRIEWRQSVSAIQIRIADNGSGIHPEDLYHIFKRFYRSRFSQDAQGLGLGLPLAKSIIETHGGTVEVDSRLNAGTTFTINFLI